MPAKKTRLFAIVLIISLIVLATLPACTPNWTVFAGLNTTCIIDINGKNSKKITKQIQDKILQYEKVISTSYEQSEVYKINHAAANTAVSVSDVTIELFELSVLLNGSSTSFNPSIFPIVELWGFSPDTYTGIAPPALPQKAQIEALLDVCKMSNFVLDKQNKTITKLNASAMLDFGAIAKGYIADEVKSVAKDTKMTVSLGGDIYTNTAVEIYVQSPFDSTYFAKVSLENKAIATCGNYQRYYEFEDTIYHHVIDKTGYPSGINDSNPIVSVSVICASGAYADALSTIIMIDGETALTELSDIEFSALIIRKNGDYNVLGENHFEIIR